MGIYLTTNPRDALNYAEEAGIGEYCRNEEDGVDEMPEPVVVTIPGSTLVQLVLSNSLRIDPDGWTVSRATLATEEKNSANPTGSKASTVAKQSMSPGSRSRTRMGSCLRATPISKRCSTNRPSWQLDRFPETFQAGCAGRRTFRPW